MATIKDRRPPAPLSTLVLSLVGAGLVAAATFWTGWYATAGNRYGLRGAAEYDEQLVGTIATAGNVTFFATLGALVAVLGVCLAGLQGRAKSTLATAGAVLGVVAVCSAAYFISELPADGRMGWCFPIYLQGSTVLLIAALRS